MSSSAKIPVLFLGATGYVGATFLSRLLTTPSLLDKIDLTLYLRDAPKAKRFTDEFGLKTIVGTLADLDKLEAASEQAHIVVSIANADDVDMTKAILKGLKKRHEKLNDRPIVYHTSGTGILIDWNYKLGNHIDERIYSDLELEKLEQIDPQAIHRPVDLLFLEADKEGYAQTVLVIPPTIFGLPEGVLFEKKLANPHSIQVPALIRGAIERKRAGLIGTGQAIWDHIHVVDLASLYMLLMQKLVDAPETVAHGRKGWYFVENGEHLHLDLVNRVGQELFALGVLESPEPVSFLTEEEVVEKAKRERFNAANGTNARSRAHRARQLGWTPKYDISDLWAYIKPEAQIIIKDMGGTKA